MTPERKKWWDSLPQREKILREELTYLKYKRSKEKERISFTWSAVVKKTILERINCYTIFIRAIRHELNRGIKDVDVEYCPWCGGEIKGGR